MKDKQALAMNKFWSDDLDTLTPYVAGEQPRDRSYIKLNTNENPFGPSDAVVDAIRAATDERLRLYPDPDANVLKEALADYYAVKKDNVFVGNGSDEVLGFAFQAFFRKEGVLGFPDITYSFYPSYCRLYGIDFKSFPLTDRFEIDIKLIPDNSIGIIIANPNAPTGVFLETGRIESVLNDNPDSLVLIDEAYIDFGGESCVPLIKRYKNLVVVQTLSKSRSLAGLRVGLAIADAELVTALERVKNSFNAYPLDSLAIAGATAAINDHESFEKNTRLVIEAREWTVGALEAMSFYVIPSRSNFIMVQHRDLPARSIFERLKKEGILVRYFDSPRLDNFLRISIGTMENMHQLAAVLKDITS